VLECGYLEARQGLGSGASQGEKWRDRRVVTERFRVHSTAMKESGIAAKGDEVAPVSTMRTGNPRFRSARASQKFSSVHAQVHIHVNQEASPHSASLQGAALGGVRA
jgi:hypothetical protein